MSQVPFRWPIHTLPRIFSAGRYPLADRNYSTRYHSVTHAMHLYDYHGIMRRGEKPLTIKPGLMTISPANGVSAYDLPKPGQHWCVHFHTTPDRAARATPMTFAELPLHVDLGADGPEAAARFAEIARLNVLANSAQREFRDIAAAAASTALLQLLLWICLHGRGDAESAPPKARHAVETAASLIESRLLDPPTIPELSEMVELTQNYLARKFKARFGTTIQRYILARRIEYARLLLITTDAPIARIARRAGLPDPQHFNKQFRSLTKMSPTQWRAAARTESPRPKP